MWTEIGYVGHKGTGGGMGKRAGLPIWAAAEENGSVQPACVPDGWQDER